MEIGKERAGAGAREDGLGMLTPEDAKELGLKPEAPEPLPCPYCGKPLERLGISVGGRVLWVSHEPCGCPGETQAIEEESALKASQDEEDRRARIATAGVKRRYFDATITDPICRAFVESYVPRAGMGLFIHGPVGTGKTYNASAVTTALALAGRGVVMTSALRILSDVKDTFDTGSSAKRELERYLSCEALVLDDLGKESASRWSVMTLYDLVNTRYESMLTTIYTSQYSLESLQERLSRAHERDTAKAIVSRIRETCLEVRLYGYDMRVPPEMPPEPSHGQPSQPVRTEQQGKAPSRGELGRFGDVDTKG